MIQPGRYTGIVSDWGYKEIGSDQKPVIEVWFDVKDQGSVKWTGWLTSKTIENTMKQLAYCGLKGDFTAIADGPIGSALEIGREVNITVEFQTDRDGKETKFTQVKWINPTQQAKFDPALQSVGKSKLAQFAGNWMKIKQEMGIKSESKVAVGF